MSGPARGLETATRIFTERYTMRSEIRSILLTALFPMALSSMANAGVFVKVADTSTPIPDGSGDFTGFQVNARIATDGSHVIFSGAGNGNQQGIYDRPLFGGGSLVRIADTKTAIPGSANTFDAMTEPAVGGGRASFRGINFSSNRDGVYSAPDVAGPLTVIADTTTPMPGPGGSGHFAAFDVPTLNGGKVAFYGIGAGNATSGIYAADAAGGPLTTLVDTSMHVPGDIGNFSGFGRVSLHGNAAAYLGYPSTNAKPLTPGGNYATALTGGSPVKIADSRSPVPGATGGDTFNHFWSPSTDGTYSVFNAQGTGGENGIYRYRLNGTGAAVVADLNTLIPGHGAAKFGYFDPAVSISTGVPVFYGSSADFSINGIYASTGAGLLKLVEAGDSVDGKVLSGLQFYDQGVANGYDNIAFYGRFSDGSSGVYVSQIPLTTLSVPEPTMTGLIGMTAPLLLRRRRQ